MKTFIIAIFALSVFGQTFAAQGTCEFESYCMGCNDDAATCSACYNQNSGTIGARELATTTCLVKISNTVEDCKYYSGTATATQDKHDCQTCNGKKFFNVSDVNDSATADTWAGANEAEVTVTCSDTAIEADGTTCTNADITGCEQLLCLSTHTTFAEDRNRNRVLGGNVPEYFKGCRMCNAGKKGSGDALNSKSTENESGAIMGYAGCATDLGITNCARGTYASLTECYVCDSEYAVASANDTSCSAFTTDANCRKLSSTWCKECKMSYFFNSQMCTLKAGLIGFSMLALLALFNYQARKKKAEG